MTREPPEGTVTVLFTDLVGSTDLATRRGDEAAQGVLRAQREVVRQQVEEHSGHEVKSTGDGFMVAFSSARRALSCAVRIQRALEEHNRRQLPEQQVSVCIGLNTGEAIQEEGDLFGAAVNAAARVAAKAHGGEILASSVLKALVEGLDVSWGEKRTVQLKGLSGDHEIWPLKWGSPDS